MSAFVHWFHILIVGSLFLYVGIKRDAICPWMFSVLMGLGAIIIAYHMYKLWLKGGGINGWVNWIHVLLIGPLLIYIGHNRENTIRPAYELLLLFGFASIGYHGYYALV
jgi:hypothetical protein